MVVQYLEAYGDSKLIINQVKREYEVRHEDLIPYHHAAIKLADSFDDFYISPCVSPPEYKGRSFSYARSYISLASRHHLLSYSGY